MTTKTPHRILHDALPIEYYRLVCRNTNLHYTKDHANSPATILNRMFVWEHTPEGHDFWYDVFDYLLGEIDELPSI